MVAFNPDVPDQRDPNYLRYSQPSSTPEGNKSDVYAGQSAEYAGHAAKYAGQGAEYAGKAAEFEGQGLGHLFKGIGEVFGEGLKAADKFVKSSIDQDVYSAVDAQRNQYSTQLENVAGPQDTSGTFIDQGTMPAFVKPGTKPITNAMSILPDAQSAPPDSIDKGLNRIDTLVAARANDKMTETMYIGQLDSIAKNLRAQYPGYREYIDQKISESTGMIPANAYIKSLIQDINAATTASKSELEKVSSKILEMAKEGVPGADSQYEKLHRTGDAQSTVTWMNKANAQQYIRSQWQDQLKTTKMSREDMAADSVIKLDNLAPQILDQHFENIIARTNIGSGSAKTIEEFIQNQIQNKGPKVPTEVTQQLGTILKSQSLDVANAIRNEAIKTGLYQSIGAEAAEKQINAHITRYNQIADFIYNEKWGPAFSVINANKAVVEDLHNKVLSDGDLGPYARFAEMAEKIGPTYSQKFFTNSVVSDSTLSKKVQEFVKGSAKDMATQADPTRQQDLLNKGPTTFKGAIQHLGNTGNGTQNATTAVLKNFNWFYDPQVEDAVKQGYAVAAFDPKNRGMLNEIQKDYTDPRTGKRVKGQIDVFEQFTSPAVTKEVVRLSQSSPQLLKNYKDWAENEFGNVIFRQDIATLRDIQNNPGMFLTWNSDNAQFGLTKVPGRFDS
jgi:hypothetical protein